MPHDPRQIHNLDALRKLRDCRVPRIVECQSFDLGF